MKPSNLENTWNSLKLENAVYDSVKKYCEDNMQVSSNTFDDTYINSRKFVK